MILSQSRVKSWEQTQCKRKWYAEITGEVEDQPNEYMVRGSFFETLCLGSGVRGQITTDLPRLKNGNKSMDQIRIESQAQRFKLLFNPDAEEYTGFQIIDRQVLIQSGEDEGTLDFVCRRDDKKSIWDLKLTTDLSGGWWSDPQTMDHIQLGFYRHLYRQKYGEDVDTYYLLMDYTPYERIKIIKVNISEESMEQFLQRFSSTRETLVELSMNLDEFPRDPNFKECVKCRLKCEVRAISPGIIYQEVNI